MDLIYSTAKMEDLGVIQDFELDFDTTDTMDFRLTVDSNIKDIPDNGFIYIPDTEYGGIIDKKTPSTSTGNTVYYGRNYRGILNSKIICPKSGQAYTYINGNLYNSLNYLLAQFGLLDYFVFDPNSLAGVTLTAYKIDRYCSFYYLLTKLEQTLNKCLYLSYDLATKKIKISYRIPVNYANETLYTDTSLDLEVTKGSRLVTHLVCLGQGELENRTVVDLWLNTDKKTINTTTQNFFGIDDYTVIYENVNCEDVESLIEEGTKKFNELINVDGVSVTLNPNNRLKIGDIVGGYEPITKTTIISTITNIIITLSAYEESINYVTT